MRHFKRQFPFNETKLHRPRHFNFNNPLDVFHHSRKKLNCTGNKNNYTNFYGDVFTIHLPTHHLLNKNLDNNLHSTKTTTRFVNCYISLESFNEYCKRINLFKSGWIRMFTEPTFVKEFFVWLVCRTRIKPNGLQIDFKAFKCKIDIATLVDINWSANITDHPQIFRKINWILIYLTVD